MEEIIDNHCAHGEKFMLLKCPYYIKQSLSKYQEHFLQNKKDNLKISMKAQKTPIDKPMIKKKKKKKAGNIMLFDFKLCTKQYWQKRDTYNSGTEQRI